MKTITSLLLIGLSCVAAFSAQIDRKTFSLTLPANWIEQTNDDMYNPDSFIFFSGPESTLFTVVIGQNSAGASVDTLVNNQRDNFVKKFKDPSAAKIAQWAGHSGSGFKIDGKIMGIMSARVTIFAFQNGDNVGLIEEYATLNDYKTYAPDFEKLRQTFKLKYAKP